LEIKQRKLLSQKAYDKRASRGIRFQTDQYTGIGAIALMFCTKFPRIFCVATAQSCGLDFWGHCLAGSDNFVGWADRSKIARADRWFGPGSWIPVRSTGEVAAGFR